MRLFLVLSIFGMLAAVVPTRLDIIGTIECQAAHPWCYTIHILDATFNTVANSFSACELTNNYKKFRLKNYQPWGGIGDWDFELQLFIKHDCGLEITDELQIVRLSFGQFSTTTQYFRKEVKIDLSKNTTEILIRSDWD
ncbi:hypothetical protein L5515_018741 [Caenorhabditis briggsae]|uniref:Uncharacterized protein n=1 Tax=Caenorhabditis briggsae TaxID=6238 RepID=A0AAE9FK42_CAEBR|nr:hypothetical protein L5515_018741 [Caenorhabditis briggsae]